MSEVYLLPDNKDINSSLNIDHIEDCFKFPKYFEIETVNACNARCVMCTINDWEQNQDVLMPDSLFQKFVEEVTNFSDWIETISLNRDGEPTLDKNLHKKVKMLKEVGIKKITFATHAELLTEKRVHEFIDANLDDVMISLDSNDKKTFEKIRLGLDFDKVFQNTLNLIRIRNERKSELKVRIRMVVMKENCHELDSWMAFWRKKTSAEKDEVYAKPAHTWGNQLGKESQKWVEKYAHKPCISPFSSLTLHSDGKVPMCAIDYNNKMLIGDFTEQTITEIWNSKNFMEIREKHLNSRRNEINMCQGCHIWEEEHKVWS